MTPAAAEVQVEVEGRTLKVSNLDKVLYPEAGFTKGQVIDYYTRVAPALLPHLQGRALTLKRYPNGVDAQFFYEKRCPSHRPSWMTTAPIWSGRKNETIDYCVVNELPALVWVANLASLELHTSLSRADHPERPTMCVFDLDPGPPATIVDCGQVGLWLRDVLDQLGVEAWAKTSGSKGLQLYVPLNLKTTYDDTKPFARALAQLLEKQHPEVVVSVMAKERRKGKVFIDWSQNDPHKTTVCVYSLRARPRPTVSTPVTWEEVEQAADGDTSLLEIDAPAVLERIEAHGDLFAPVVEKRQKLPKPPAP